MSVYLEGNEVKINSDFRNVIKFYNLMADDEIDEESKFYLAIRLFFSNYSFADHEIVTAAFNEIKRFVNCYEEVPESNEGKSSKAVFDFNYDANYIYAAFMQVYKIDITEVSMHWFKFKALLDALPDDTQFRQVIKYRSIAITDSMSKDEKKYYRKMKKLYALPNNRTEREKDDEFVESFG